MKSLTIISHTEHYRLPNGKIVGLGSTVTEINHLLGVFESITHVAMLHDVTPPSSALPYVSERIKFVPIPAVGGNSLLDKLSILRKAPKILSIVRKSLQRSDVFQFRAPTGIGVFVIPYLVLFSSKKGWFKYAGNWMQSPLPASYRFQRWLLKNQKRSVTINGQWPNQPKQCLTFENPCLTSEEIRNGQRIRSDKKLHKGLRTLCFVGRLEKEKGLDLLMQSLKELTINLKSKIEAVHIVGDGIEKEYYQQMASKSGVNFVFHGFLSREGVHTIYEKSHAIILPSASEGFPKVIAEAMNYGCLPIVSNVSSISQYVQDGINGFLLEAVDLESTKNSIRTFLESENSMLFELQDEFLSKFTYDYYNMRLLRDIL